jgi:hypothetical protein
MDLIGELEEIDPGGFGQSEARAIQSRATKSGRLTPAFKPASISFATALGI